MRSRPWILPAIVVGLSIAVSTLSSHTAFAQVSLPVTLLARERTTRFEYDTARTLLAPLPDSDPQARLERGRLALHEGRCVDATRFLEGATQDDGPLVESIAKGCARVTAGTRVVLNKDKGVEIVFQDENDVPLAEWISDTVALARDAITRDLESTWTLPTRVLLVRDHLSLSATTGLPYENARKTGIVAIAKWGRVTMISPRATGHGFMWRETLAHELTHLAITKATTDRAPLWLQEGLAKTEENAWRPASVFDNRPSPSGLSRFGIDKKMDLALDKLGPSLAMLPNADIAAVAYAEVTSFVQFYRKSVGPKSFPELLKSIDAGRTVDEALVERSGKTLKEWDVLWRKSLEAVKPEPLVQPREGDPKAMREWRKRRRLAELLHQAGRSGAAAKELGRAILPADDPYGRALAAVVDWSLVAVQVQSAGAPKPQLSSAWTKLGDETKLPYSHAAWWFVRGLLFRESGDLDGASRAFRESAGENPNNPDLVCGEQAFSAFCPSAKAYSVPPFSGE